MQLGAGGAPWVRTAGSGAEPQPKSNLVHFSLKIWYLVATSFMILLRINWPNFVQLYIKLDVSGSGLSWMITMPIGLRKWKLTTHYYSRRYGEKGHSLPLEVGPLNQARSLGERCELPQRGLEQSPSRSRIWCIWALKSGSWWQRF